MDICLALKNGSLDKLNIETYNQSVIGVYMVPLWYETNLSHKEKCNIYFLDELPYEINLYSILIIFIISIIISAIASYLPATKISKMNTFRALRYE